jgi:hypothetical protein
MAASGGLGHPGGEWTGSRGGPGSDLSHSRRKPDFRAPVVPALRDPGSADPCGPDGTGAILQRAIGPAYQIG